MTKRKGAHDDDGDMLVIGSGLGGSVAAVQLAEEGDRVRVSAVWRKVSDRDLAETTCDVKRFTLAPLELKGTQRIYLLGKVMVHVVVRSCLHGVRVFGCLGRCRFGIAGRGLGLGQAHRTAKDSEAQPATREGRWSR